MSRSLAKLLFACVLAAATLLALAPSAPASRTQLLVMQDDTLVTNATERNAALDEMKALGADVVKLQVLWRDIAPGQKPADPANPANYNWGVYDAAVRAVLERGMQPFLALGGRAPNWAIRKQTKHHNGVYRPSPTQFRNFAIAAGRRFPGVHIWSAWNEPNLSAWLLPQRRRGVPLSPSIYRRLYLAAQRGLEDSGHGSDTILLGELMPLGSGSQRKVTPLDFLREMVCLDRRYRQYRGRAKRARGCTKVGRIPTSGIAYHPYPPRGGIHARPRRGEATITTLRRLTRLLDRLARKGKLPRRTPIWITEFGFQSDPPDPFQYRLGRIPGFMDESEQIAYRNRRVRSYSQYTLRDDPPNSGPIFRRWAGFQMGLRFASGGAKAGVYDAFRMPAFVRALGKRVSVFVGRRTAPGATAVVYSRKKGGSYKELGRMTLNSAGYARRIFKVTQPGRRIYRIEVGSVARTKRPRT
jgi:hypothetical protein